MSSESKVCQNCKIDFIIESDDFLFYEKMKVPAPMNCPQCRQQQRMQFRNFKTLYKRVSSKSGKSIISMYGPHALFPVYENSEWWGDDWEAMDYGRDVDFSRSFLEQVHELFNSVPHPAMLNIKSVNCEYSNMTLNAKNCYLVFGCVDDEDCDYGHIVWDSREAIDNLYIFKCESCYECIDCLGSAKLFYSQECESCVDSTGLFDCRNCLNCIGCVGLVNKSYHIFNQPVTKEAYEEFKKIYPLTERSSIEYIFKQREELRKKAPQRSFFGSHNTNVSGNHIYNSGNVFYSFDIKGGEDSKYCFTAQRPVDSYDASFCGGNGVSECYQVLTSIGNKIMSSQLVIDSHDVFYSNLCYSSNDLFGCSGLRKKSYCILNKQYSKEEYEILKGKIIEHMKQNGEWGNFFPASMSPFGYNETIANEYIPLTKEVALAQGFAWRDDIPTTKGQGTIAQDDLPTNPEEYSDDLINEVLTCETCEKNYKLINREINFYKKNKLALPHECFNCRHAKRMSMRNPRNLWKGSCANCDSEILTSYRPEDQNKYQIYCEKCYQQEVY